MSAEKQGGVPAWAQITIVLIGALVTISVAWITTPVRFQATVGQGKPDAVLAPAEGAVKPAPVPAPPTPAPAQPVVPAPIAATAPTPDKPAVLPPPATPAAASARNPFGVTDVFDVEGEDVKAFAAKVKPGSMISGKNEFNAPQWAGTAVPGVRGKLEGEWASRWRSGLNDPWETGTGTVREVGGRVFLLYSNPKPAYMIEAVREGKTRLVGRYVNLKMPLEDNSPWVGEVIGDERIDGKWTGGRWDLRRQLR